MGLHVVIGGGQVGMALKAVLKQAHRVLVLDAEFSDFQENLLKVTALKGEVDILHICFPYDEQFLDSVRRYKEQILPRHTVIHSTVPIGTSCRCGASHSPVVGPHPDLERSLLTFTKFIGGPKASAVADQFRAAGIKVYLVDKQETTELIKLASTTFYGLCIEYTRHMKQQCIEHGVPFEAWTIWTRNYNEGYLRLGRHEYVRPELVPIMTEIGGHCVLPNCNLFDSVFAKFVREFEC